MADVSLIEAIESYKENEEITERLEQFFINIAQTGFVPTTWDKMKTLFIGKLNKVVEEFYKITPFNPKQNNRHCEQDKYEDMKLRLNELVLGFDEPPFTIQRLCELLTQPKKNYTKCEKFMRGVEKNLMVVSSWKKGSTGHSINLPKLTINGLQMPSNIDHTMIPSPVSTVPPSIPGGICFNTPDVKEDNQPQSSDANSDPQSTKEDDLDAIEDKNQEPELLKEESEEQSCMEVGSTSEIPPTDKPQIHGKRKSESEVFEATSEEEVNNQTIQSGESVVESTKKPKTEVTPTPEELDTPQVCDSTTESKTDADLSVVPDEIVSDKNEDT